MENSLNLIKQNIKRSVIGKDDIIDLLLVSLICSGHIIIEDLPGLGKTTLAASLAMSSGCDFQRIQFTPDVLPSDITGFNIFDIKTGSSTFHKGSIHNQIILADEINRASPKTQSALLEAMQEGQVTVDGKTYKLPRPFMILATQNPIDMAGTYPLPEAQMDRFLMRISLGYPEKQDELNIVRLQRGLNDTIKLNPVVDSNEILALQDKVKNIFVDDKILDYIVNIVAATRNAEGVLVGASPRGSISLTKAACGLAILRGRDYVIPDDVKYLAPYVLSHRIVMKKHPTVNENSTVNVINSILNSIKVPKL